MSFLPKKGVTETSADGKVCESCPSVTRGHLPSSFAAVCPQKHDVVMHRSCGLVTLWKFCLCETIRTSE